MNVKADNRYTEDHEWVQVEEGNVVKVGISHFAQSELGELVFIEVDTVGQTIEKGEIFGTLEAVKTTSDLFMPVSGTILEFNPELAEDEGDNPALINEDPYDKGWIVRIEVSDICDLDGLMDAEDYQKLIG
ncbi:UNVERIFIED_CONTAM: hypothetical protein GTU68_021103 [Idotea baltica]|nr:hypothetical protein [Idotea baltica]